jgi:pimeloyl-ACP methyl ester carboxylesterase
MPTARIMTFGYDADVVKLWGMAGNNTLRNHGKSLASDVSDQRRGHRERPIIFIAHSLGGLVCEQALLICREGNANLEKLFQSTKGIIFMGTPHGGSGLATLGRMFAKYLKIIRHTNPAIVGVLQQESEVLTAVQQQFQQVLLHKPNGNISIYCFFEEKPVVGVGVIVPEQSAVLNQYPNQSIGANHMDMTKFSGRNDVGYQRVLNRVHDLVELMTSAPASDRSQREPLSESSQNPPRVGNLEPDSSVPERGVSLNQTINSTSSGAAIGIGNQNVQGDFHIRT